MEDKAPHEDEALYVNGRNSVKLILISGGKKRWEQTHNESTREEAELT
jgi:hypothetical protein